MGPIVKVAPLAKRFLALAHVRGCRHVLSSAWDLGIVFRQGSVRPHLMFKV